MQKMRFNYILIDRTNFTQMLYLTHRLFIKKPIPARTAPIFEETTKQPEAAILHEYVAVHTTWFPFLIGFLFLLISLSIGFAKNNYDLDFVSYMGYKKSDDETILVVATSGEVQQKPNQLIKRPIALNKELTLTVPHSGENIDTVFDNMEHPSRKSKAAEFKYLSSSIIIRQPHLLN
ncbi:hypothetical protein RF11_02262 [Thelohanellus kitauei]|uniref:Uncharacterized protein n=1 Tax=Thelohanellus kitauei TaxID=669202 RepID=A0A0C2IDQ7_THEKT|nr:hypothetical protein RF11_02262 [Thelohanellus kitauei]